MPSIVPGFEYDIFISYRHNDNRSGWVTEFVRLLQEELSATIKDPVSIYFDINPHDGLLETHNVDKSLEGKLKCLIFIPILSQTYCDPKSFAWRHEFVAFNNLASEDQFGRDIKLSNGNVSSRILPIKIHDLESEDKSIIENEIGGVVRSIEFIFKSAGVNRPLRSKEDHANENLNKTYYNDQVNKVANAIKGLLQAIKTPAYPNTSKGEEKVTTGSINRKKIIGISALLFLTISLVVYFLLPKWLSTKVESEQINSVAILPFTNLSSDEDQEYFSDGMTEQIITNLAHINSLKVIARTSVMKFKKTNKSITEIGKELNVTHILEGSIRKSDDRIRVTAQLIAVKDQSHVWAQDYDRNLADIFTIQDEVSMAIASSLQRRLTPQDYENMKSERTSSIEAYQRYLKASNVHNEVFYIKLLKDDFTKAENEFKSVIQLDPAYGIAYAGLADLYDTYVNFSAKSEKERMTYEVKRDSCSSMAIRLSPNNSYVISVRAYSFSDITQADSVFKYRRKALAITPNDVVICTAMGVNYARQGLYYQAIQLRERAISLDPTFGHNYALLANAYLSLGEFKKAETLLQRAIIMDPQDIGALRMLVELKLTTNDLTGAESTIQRIQVINQQGSRSWYELYISAMKSALKGEKEKALDASKEWQIYWALGMKNEALDELEKKPSLHYLNLKNSPVFNPLRKELRFKGILENTRIVYEERLKKYAN